MKWRSLLLVLIVNSVGAQVPEVKLFQFHREELVFQLASDFQEDLREIPDYSFGGSYGRNLLRESIRFSGRGSIYHPDLLIYRLGLEFGLNQGELSMPDSLQSLIQDEGFFRNGSFYLALLPVKPFSLNFSAAKQFRRVDRELALNVRANTIQWQAGANYRNKLLPLSLDYDDYLYEENYGERQVATHQRTLNLSGHLAQRDKYSANFRIRQGKLRREESSLYKIDERIASYDVSVGYLERGSRGKSIQLYANALDIDGPQPTRNINISLPVSKNLPYNFNMSSSYAYRYYAFKGQPSISHSISTRINHQLYLSLASQAEINGSQYLQPGYREDRLRGKIAWNYTKNLPVGRLEGVFSWEREGQRYRAAQGSVRLESVTNNFSMTNPLILETPGIDTTSIRITNLDQTIPYRQSIDFSIVKSGYLVAIYRLPESTIPDSAEVLITYNYYVPITSDLASTSMTYGLAYRIRKWYEIRVGFEGQSFQYDKYPVEALNQLNGYTSKRWLFNLDIDPVELEIEKEHMDSRLIPYKRLAARLRLMLGTYAAQYIAGEGQYSRQDYYDRHDVLNQTRFQIEYFRRMGRGMVLSTSFSFKNELGTLNNIREKRWLTELKILRRHWDVQLSYLKLHFVFNGETKSTWRWQGEVNIRP